MKKFLLLFIVLGLSLTSKFTLLSYAENEDLIVFTDFSGGLDNHTNSFSLPNTTATDALNVRFNDQFRSLAKRNSLISYGDSGDNKVTSIYRYYKSDSSKYLLSTDDSNLKLGDDDARTFITLKDNLTTGKRMKFTTYMDICIGTNGSDQPIKWDGKDDITADTDGNRTEKNLCAELGAPFAELNTGTNLDSEKWYQYKMLYFDGSFYYYSDARSNPILTGATVQDITLTDIPLGPTGIVSRQIYRTEGKATRADVLGDTTYKLVARIDDNTTDTYDDAIADASLGASLSTTGAINLTPPTGKYITVQKERVFISGNSTYKSDIYWSEQFKADVYYGVSRETGFEQIRPDDGDEITSITGMLNYIAISKRLSWQKFYTDGTPGDNWYVSDVLPGALGCPAPYSVARTNKGIAYLNRYGIYLFNGSNSEFISDAVTKTIRDINQTNIEETFGTFWDNKYLFAYTSEETGSSINDRLLIYDFIRNAYTLDTKNINCMASFESGTDFGPLYYGSSTDDGYIFTEGNTDTSLMVMYKSDLDDGTFDDCRSFGTESEPYVQLAWDLTWGADFQTIVNLTIGDMTTSTFARQDTDGTWTSKVYQINASTLDKLYWNENLNGTGDVEIQLRTGASETACSTASWSSVYTDPSGSDISDLTANDYTQIQANLSTSDIIYTPQLTKADGYLFNITYDREGTDYETSIQSLCEWGWQDKFPGFFEVLLHAKIFYEGTDGTLTFNYENLDGTVSDSFDIDLSQEPNVGQVTPNTDADGNTYIGVSEEKVFVHHFDSPIGRAWRFSINDNGLEKWRIKRIEILCKRDSLEYY